MNRDEFFQIATDPHAMPDEMDFHLIGTTKGMQDGKRGFSVEGFEAIGYQMHDWLMARVLAYYKRHGRFPSSLRASTVLHWNEDAEAETLEQESDDPWWHHIDMGGTPISPDGEHRLRAFLKDREREGK